MPRHGGYEGENPIGDCRGKGANLVPKGLNEHKNESFDESRHSSAIFNVHTGLSMIWVF